MSSRNLPRMPSSRQCQGEQATTTSNSPNARRQPPSSTLSPGAMFDLEVVKRSSVYKLRPFVDGYNLENDKSNNATNNDDSHKSNGNKNRGSKPSRKRSLLMGPVFRPLLLDNRLYLQEQWAKADAASRPIRKETHEDDPVTYDLLHADIHEMSLLQERHSHRIPWDFSLRKGLRAYSEGDHETAVTFFKAVHPHVSCGCTYMLRGIANFRRGHFLQSEMDLTLSLEEVGEDPYVRYNRGLARSQLSDFQGAIEDFTAAILLKPSEPNFYTKRGLVYRRMKDYASAERDYNTAFTLSKRTVTFGTTSTTFGTTASALVTGGGLKDVTEALALPADDRSLYQLDLLCSASSSKPLFSELTSTERMSAWKSIKSLTWVTNDRITLPSPDNSDGPFYYLWSGQLTRRLPIESVNPSIPHWQVRPGVMGGPKYELLTKVLGEGNIMGYETSRVRSKVVFVAEEDTVVLEIPPAMFETIFQPVLLLSLEKKLKALREVPAFRQLPEDELIGLASNCKEVTVETGANVITQDQPAQALYLVTAGVGRVFKHLEPYDGKPMTVEIGKAWSGHILGERAVQPRGAAYPFTVQADTRMILIEIQLAQVDFVLWTPAMCRQFQCSVVDVLEDMKLLQSAITMERWHEERNRILVG